MTLTFPTGTDRLSVILKLAGDACNINCTYCYEKRKPYANTALLEPETLRRFLALFSGRPLSVELHGGEPLVVNRAKMRELLRELRGYSGPIALRMQTNGTLLDSRWLGFFEEEWRDIELGISLDGDFEATSYRVDYGGKAVHQRIERSLRLCQTRGWRIGVVAVVTRRSLNRAPQLIDYFAGFESIRYLKFAPCMDFNIASRPNRRPKSKAGSGLQLLPMSTDHIDGVPDWGTTPLEYADFLIEAYDHWKMSGAFQQFVLEPTLSVMRKVMGRRTSFCHFNDQKCAHVMTLYPNGVIGSCDELSAPESVLGHVMTTTSAAELTQMSSNPSLSGKLGGLLAKCGRCAYQPTCGGGCLATRLRYEGTDYDDEYCEHRMKIIDHVSRDLSEMHLASPAAIGGIPS